MAGSRTRLFNTLSGALLALSGLTLVCYALIFVVDPFRPASIASLPTPAPSPTDTPTVTPTPSQTRRPTNTSTSTPMPSPTLTAPALRSPRPKGVGSGAEGTPVITQTVSGSVTPTPSATPGPSPTPTRTLSPFNYVMTRLEYSRSNYGLNWAGIAGLVFGLDRKHQTNILVRAWGDPPLGAEGQETVSSVAQQYGISGFEFTLGDKPVTGKWNVQLIGDDGQPLSDAIPIAMNSDPRSNLAFIIFEQNH